MRPGIAQALKFNPSRARLEAFVQRAADAAPIGALVLDAGAGEGYYRSLFSKSRYQAADLCKIEKAYGRIHYICDLTHIPIQDAAYDLVVCTQVMEHVPDPDRVLAEFYRVLKPSGQLWFSAPFFFPEHEVPYDFYRYTHFGLKHLLQTAGFEVQEIDWLEGYSASLAFQCRIAARSLSLSPSAYGSGLPGLLVIPLILVLKPFFYVLSLIFNALEMRSKFAGAGFGKNLCGVACKPSLALPVNPSK